MKAGDFHIVAKEGEESMIVYWKVADDWKSNMIPRKEFERLNPEFIKLKAAQNTGDETRNIHLEKLEHVKHVELPRKNGVIQAQEYNRNTGQAYHELIENGFADGGRSAQYFGTKEAAEKIARDLNCTPNNSDAYYTVSKLPDGSYGVSNREFILVDRVNDPFLRQMMHSMERLKSIADPKERAQAMLRFVYDESEKLTHIK